MTPDYETAALKAAETLIKHNVSTGPIVATPILTSFSNVIILSYAEMAQKSDTDRHSAVNCFGVEHQDAVTLVQELNGKLCYIITYNQRLPFYVMQRALARELGHIVLGHDGSRPEDVRDTEAKVFARQFLCPRPMIRAVQDAGVTITAEVLGSMTGCYDRCIDCLRDTPGAHVPAELNRLIREQFADYVSNFLDYYAIVAASDKTAPVDFGTYMDNYVE